jgi:peptidoglycan lytic transglycosylase G
VSSRARPAPGPRRRHRLVVLLVLVTVLAAGALALAWRHETTSVRIERGDPTVRLVVAPGSSAGLVGRQLRDLGLVSHPAVFRVLVKARGVGGELKAGEYALSGPLSLEEILEMILAGEVVRREVTIPEGRTLEETAALVGAQGLDLEAFLAAARDPSPVHDLDPEAADLEGYLFPDTYEIPLASDPEKRLVQRMVRRFRDVIDEEAVRIRDGGFTVREVVTLASLVELETARAEERPRIAAVFLNRLKRGMPLQTDPTVIYAMKQEGRWNGNIRRRDLDIDSPYNTYRRAGLPPGPIGSPGREAIRGVL